MQEAIDHPLPRSAETRALAATADRAAQWAGEPFLHAGEDPEQVLAAGTARRRALDDANTEIDAGRKEPSNDWKIRYALMLGLERILSEKPPHLRSGTELRRHQVDALAGMLTELIAAAQRQPELVADESDEDDDEDEEPEEYENGDNGENGDAEEPEAEAVDELSPEQ